MAITYPDTQLKLGLVDVPFGGVPNNRYGVPARTFQDAQIRELEKQVIADQWAMLRCIRAVITSGGVAGDVVVFNSLAAAALFAPTFTKLTAVSFDADNTPIVGVLFEPAAAAAVARIAVFGSIPNSITSLATNARGEVTYDTGTGRLRLKAAGEVVVGVVDLNGNTFLRMPGFTP